MAKGKKGGKGKKKKKQTRPSGGSSEGNGCADPHAARNSTEDSIVEEPIVDGNTSMETNEPEDSKDKFADELIITPEEKLYRWDAICAGLVDCKKTWDTLQDLPPKRKNAIRTAAALISIPISKKKCMKREIFNYVLCRTYGWLDLSSHDSSAHLIPRERLYNRKKFRTQMILIRAAWYCVRMKREVCRTLATDPILNYYCLLFMGRTEPYWEIMHMGFLGLGSLNCLQVIDHPSNYIHEASKGLDASIIPPFFEKYNSFKPRASIIPETQRRLELFHPPLAMRLPAASERSRLENICVVSFVEAQCRLRFGIRKMFDSHNRPFYLNLFTETMTRTNPADPAPRKIKRKSNSKKARGNKPMTRLAFEYYNFIELIVRWRSFSHEEFPQSTAAQQFLDKTYNYTAPVPIPQLEFRILRKKFESTANPDFHLDHDEHSYRSLLQLEWKQLPPEIQHWFYHRWIVAMAYREQRVVRWREELSLLYPPPLSDSHKNALRRYREVPDKELVNAQAPRLFANPDRIFANYYRKMQDAVFGRGRRLTTALGDRIVHGLRVLEERESESNQVDQVEQQEEGRARPDSETHRERECYRKWCIKLTMRKGDEVHPEELHHPLLGLFGDKTGEHRDEITREDLLQLVQEQPMASLSWILDGTSDPDVADGEQIIVG